MKLLQKDLMMTLNVTILSPKIIYQSADYALFNETSNRPISTPSTKVVSINEMSWTGFITYTGIGREGTRDTSRIIKTWLKELKEPNIEDIVELLKTKATKWINRIRPGAKHTFVLAAFKKKTAIAYVISNFQKWDGGEFKTSDKFVVSRISTRKRVKIIVTGVPKAVPRESIKKLKYFLKTNYNDGLTIRQMLADITNAAALRYPGLISKECFAYSQDINGKSFYERYGNIRTMNPSFFQDGALEAIVSDLADSRFGKNKWSISTMGAARIQPKAIDFNDCILILEEGFESSAYSAMELPNVKGGSARALSINSKCEIVGDAPSHKNGQRLPCCWLAQSEQKFLMSLGSNTGTASCINDNGAITGSLTLNPNETQSFK